jgi:hypothetical protein
LNAKKAARLVATYGRLNYPNQPKLPFLPSFWLQLLVFAAKIAIFTPKLADCE